MTHTNKYNPDPEKIEIVEKKLQDVLSICQIYRIPFFATFAASDSEWKNYAYSATANNIPLSDDQIRRHMLVANGFEVVPKREQKAFIPFSEDLYGYQRDEE